MGGATAQLGFGQVSAERPPGGIVEASSGSGATNRKEEGTVGQFVARRRLPWEGTVDVGRHSDCGRARCSRKAQ